MRKVSVAAFAAFLLQAGQLSAHHSFGMFDTTKRVVVEGAMKAFQMVNPHSFLVLTAKDAAGKDVEWWIEAGSLVQLKRQGWTRQSVKAGDKVSLIINPLREDRPGGYLVQATVNGRLVGQPAPPVVAPATGG